VDFEPLARQIELVRQTPLTDEAAKLIIYQAFVEGELEAPRHLARAVHENYFRPIHGEFEPRAVWSLSNAFPEPRVLHPYPDKHFDAIHPR
jgi:hypothetical protein